MNIKTPEESKFSEDDFKYYTDTIVRIIKNAICKKGSTPNDAIDELNSFFAEAISAERNANLEKKSICDCCKEEAIMICHKCYQVEYIQPLESANLEKIREIREYGKSKFVECLEWMEKVNELEKELDEAIKIRFEAQKHVENSTGEFAKRVLSLESKLAEAEKTIKDRVMCYCGDIVKLEDQVKQLEAEAKAVREALEWIKNILPNTNEQIDHILKERSHELYHILCVDIPTMIDRALNNEKE